MGSILCHCVQIACCHQCVNAASRPLCIIELVFRDQSSEAYMLVRTRLGVLYGWHAATPTSAKPSQEWSKQHCPVKAEHLAVAKKKIQELRDWLYQQRPEQQRQQPSSRVLLLTGGWGHLHIMVGRIIPAAHVCWSGNTVFQLSVQLWLEHRSIRGFWLPTLPCRGAWKREDYSSAGARGRAGLRPLRMAACRGHVLGGV